MGAVGGASEVHHAVEAGEGSAMALVAVGVEFLLGEDVSAGLDGRGSVSVLWEGEQDGRVKNVL